MLFIGLEMNLSEIRKTGKHALLISITSLVLPFFVGYQLSVVFGLDLIESLFIGLLLSVTSVPVSAMILRELGILKTKTGTTVISVAIIDDIISLILLAIILQLHIADGTSFNFEEIGISIFQISAYLIGITFWLLLFIELTVGFQNDLNNFLKKQKHMKQNLAYLL